MKNGLGAINQCNRRRKMLKKNIQNNESMREALGWHIISLVKSINHYWMSSDKITNVCDMASTRYSIRGSNTIQLWFFIWIPCVFRVFVCGFSFSRYIKVSNGSLFFILLIGLRINCFTLLFGFVFNAQTTNSVFIKSNFR